MSTKDDLERVALTLYGKRYNKLGPKQKAYVEDEIKFRKWLKK